jgi:hypothetical protein
MVRSRKNERIVLQIREKVALDTKMGGCYFECGKVNFLSSCEGWPKVSSAWKNPFQSNKKKDVRKSSGPNLITKSPD